MGRGKFDPPSGFSKNLLSKVIVKPFFFVTFDIIVSHIFLENFIEIPQFVQKTWRLSPPINFHQFFGSFNISLCVCVCGGGGGGGGGSGGVGVRWGSQFDPAEKNTLKKLSFIRVKLMGFFFSFLATKMFESFFWLD